VPGDVTDPGHRAALVAAARALGPVTLLMNNASALGPSPQPALSDYPAAELARVYAVNVLAPVALTQLVTGDLLAAGGTLINVSSDAAVEPYPGWGGYGSQGCPGSTHRDLRRRAPGLAVYALDPGDMRTRLCQLAFPGTSRGPTGAPRCSSGGCWTSGWRQCRASRLIPAVASPTTARPLTPP
jgi:NAD(P)-dependent dehydrogenase (short-subunit alcohol dehydrogenase family)